MPKPLIVYISGAPGSGKTTLGRLLSEQLYIPQISSDLIHGGIAFSNPTHDRKETLKNTFVPTLINLSQNGISFIADHVLQADLSETDIIDRLRPYAEIIYIHTTCTNPLDCYIKRIESSNLPSIVSRREHLLGLVDSHRQNLVRTSEPLKLNLPTLIVNTDNKYDPSVPTIIEFINDNYKT